MNHTFPYIRHMEQKIYSPSEIARILKVSDESIYKALREQRMKGYKKFGKWFVFWQDVEEFIKSVK